MAYNTNVDKELVQVELQNSDDFSEYFKSLKLKETKTYKRFVKNSLSFDFNYKEEDNNSLFNSLKSILIEEFKLKNNVYGFDVTFYKLESRALLNIDANSEVIIFNMSDNSINVNLCNNDHKILLRKSLDINKITRFSHINSVLDIKIGPIISTSIYSKTLGKLELAKKGVIFDILVLNVHLTSKESMNVSNTVTDKLTNIKKQRKNKNIQNLYKTHKKDLENKNIIHTSDTRSTYIEQDSYSDDNIDEYFE